MSIEEIVSNIDARIAALESDIQPLLDAKVALLDSVAAPKPTKQRPVEKPAAATVNSDPKSEPPQPTPKPRGAARRRRVDPVPSGKLIALLEGSEGLSATALAKETGGNTNQVRGLLNELIGTGQVRKTGQRRATRWHLITEEEQIAARAAEIEAQMNAPPTARSRTHTRARRT